MFDCKRCGTSTPRLITKQDYCPMCEYELSQPKSYGILNGGRVHTDNPNPFVQNAAQNKLRGAMERQNV